MSAGSKVSIVWIRALLLCEDVRFELGDTMTLVGVFADRIVVEPGAGELVLPRFAIYGVVAGLTGVTELSWRQTLTLDGEPSGSPLGQGRERHDAACDEHRIVNLVSPLVLPGAGRYRLAVEIETTRARRSLEHHFVVERARTSAA
jgi:hypothetical protein